MNGHYDDYVKKSVPASSIVFESINDVDKALLKEVKKEHIRANIWFLIPMLALFLLCLWGTISSILTPFDNLITDIFTLIGFIAGLILSGYWLHDIFAGFKGYRKGVVLSKTRFQEKKDNRNATYQYVFDMYIEETDQALMSYLVDQEVFADVEAGDGVILLKRRKKIKILADPSRKGVMDVSKVKSGVK